MAVVGLADEAIEPLVVKVVEPSEMTCPWLDLSCEVEASKLAQEVGGLLPVADASERAVLPFDEYASMEQRHDQESCLAVAESKPLNGRGALVEMVVNGEDQHGGYPRTSSAKPARRPRPPRPPEWPVPTT